ncbi:hypothetical protein K1T71_000520 [Dendrolimus kikuchii]|uniref:Uncharacterized protein n=1 Tax=Dendrolimus kikuchii TaxID=765133 RepID=A0ACC1DJL1_9NEOP|nr:hypothetical protein K1T71_000520 [Dendrolimus kikuchii]
MWSESDGERELQEHEVGMGRSSAGSELVMMDNRATPSSSWAAPGVANLNVTRFSKVHIGNKFVTQNVHNSEVVKELSFPVYIWNHIKNTTRAERLICASSMVALVICIVLILTFTLRGSMLSDDDDVAPHEWNITRNMWLAAWANNTQTTEPFEPLRLVIIQHTVSPECNRFINCAAELRNLQSYFLNNLGYDIPYNFMVGNEGRIYEGRGLGMVGAHTYGYNSCTIGIGFIGDYREGVTQVTPLQVANVQRLLAVAVERGLLHPDYHVVGARDLRSTQSPGLNLYKEIQSWDHYDHNELYRDKNCTEIRAMFENSAEAKY